MIGLDIGYTDEIFIILLLPLLLKRFLFSKKGPNIWLSLILFIIISLINSIFSGYFRGFGLTILDLFLFLKPILLILSFTIISEKVRNKFLEYVSYSGTFYIYISFIFYFINIYFRFQIQDVAVQDVRFGLTPYAFIAANAGEFLNSLVLIGSAIYKNPKVKHLSSKLSLIGFLLLTTLRFKAFVVLFSAILLFFYFKSYNKRITDRLDIIKNNIGKHKYKICFILLVALIPGWSQFKLYFLSEAGPRLLLLKTSLQLGLQYFPFGVGAGTFGSAVARRWYSPVYIEHRFSKFYGMSGKGSISYLNDNFWPMVYAQYGFIGLILIIVIYTKILRWIWKNLVSEKYTYEIYFILFFSLTLSTLGSGILMGPLGILYLMVLGSIVNSRKNTI